MNNLCPVCGWGDQIQPHCRSVEEAVVCKLNWSNRLKYGNRYKGEINRGEMEISILVRSVRYQGKDGKGDSNEQFEPVTIESARRLFDTKARQELSIGWNNNKRIRGWHAL